MKVAAAFSGGLSVALLLFGACSQAGRAAETVRVGIYQNQPKVFIEPTGSPAGFWVDVLTAIAQAENWALEYRSCEWEQCLQAIEQGQLDLMVDVAYSTERDRRFDFNREVVLVSWSEVYARPGNTLNSFLDLDQKRIAVLEDSIQQAILAERAEAFDIQPHFVEVDTFEAIFQQIEAGTVDAGVVNHLLGNQMLADYTVVRTAIVFNPSRLHFIVKEGDLRGLIAPLDRQIQALKASPNSAYYRAQNTWLEPQAPFLRITVRQVFIQLALFVPLVGLVAIAIRNYLLRQEINRRKRAEAQLQTLADNMPGMIFRYVRCADGTEALRYVSSGCRDLWELDPRELRQTLHPFWNRIGAEDASEVRVALEQSAQALSPWNCECQIVTPSGKHKWVQISARPQRQANGEVIWDGLILDISSRKATEAALKISESRFQRLADNVPGVIFGYRLQPDGSDQFTYISSGFKEVYGFGPEAAIEDSNRVWRMVHPEDVDRLRQSVIESYQTLETWQCQYRVLTPEGRLKWLQGISRPTQKANGEVIWDGIIIDISDRQQAEAALLKSERRFRNMAENVPGAILQYVLHPDGSDGILYISRGCYDLWEVTAEAAIENGQLLWDLVHPDDRVGMYEAVMRSAQTLETWCWQWRIITPSGIVKWLEAAGRPEPHDNGDIIWDTVIINISDRKHVEAALQESEVRYRKVVEAQTDFILRSRPDTTITFANTALCRALGIDPGSIVGKKWSDFANPDDLEEGAFRELAHLSPENPRCFIENRDTRADGQEGWTQWLNEGIFDASGRLLEIQSVGRDITELKQIEQALRTSEERLRLVTENMSDLVCLHDVDGTYLYVTPSSYPLLGYRPEEMIGCDPYAFFHPDDRDRVRLESHDQALANASVPITYRIRTKTGAYLWLETLTQAILDEAGQVIHLQTTSRDVSDRVAAEQQLKHDALHDGLTGLPNRTLLMERLELALQRTKQRPEFQFAVLFLDLDNFKVVNDSLGHLVGDELLLTVAHQLSGYIRETDIAARLGGDEFVILLEEIKGLNEAVRIAEQLLEALKRPFEVADREVFISVSIGIVFSTVNYHRAVDLLRDADLAMYRAKHSGRSTYAIFDPNMHLQVVQR